MFLINSCIIDKSCFVTEYIPTTKVKPQQIAAVLKGYDTYTKRYLINGFTFGFRIGCIRTPDKRELPSIHKPVIKNIEAARQLVQKEL